MQFRVLLAAPILIPALVGCAESTSPPEADPVVVETLSPVERVAQVNSEIAELPAIRIVSRISRTPAVERDVHWVVETPERVRTTIVMKTDAEGVARLPAWRMGEAPGVYTATALTDLWSVSFRAVAGRGVVAIYDLELIDGVPVPAPGWFVTEAHFVLYEGGVWNYFANSPAGPFASPGASAGRFARIGTSRIDFDMAGYRPPFGSTHADHYADAIPTETGFIVHYSDWMGYGVETYRLRSQR